MDVGRAGTGYVNDYNGNAIFIHEDLSMSGNRLPVNIKHVFNSNDKDIDIGYGPGWRLNLNQRVIPKTIGGNQWYQYIDEDGTSHYFYYDSATGKYKDEITDDLTLVKNADSTYTISDKKDNLLIFTASGYLYLIKDSNGNTQTLSYAGAVLQSVTDGAGRVTTLTSNTNGYLLSIKDPAQRTISFSYNGAQLNRIIDPDNNYSEYNYDSNKNLSTTKTYDGYTLTYLYNNKPPFRVSDMKESGTGVTAGQSLKITYGNNTNIFEDGSKVRDAYQFNTSGQTICIKGDDGSAQYYSYDSGKNVNKLSSSSKLQKTTKNYLKNHNAEVSAAPLAIWNGASSTNSTGTSTFSTEAAYIGKQSLKINMPVSADYQAFGQSVTLEKGKTYTLSAYVKTVGVSSGNKKGAYIYFNYQDSTGKWVQAPSSYINGTNDWQRIEVQLTYPDNALNNSALVRLGIANEAGTAYFDCVQLEEGSIANRYNILENSDFSFGTTTPDFWTRNANLNTSDALITTTDTTHPQPMDLSRFLIYGSTTKSKSIYQEINTSGNNGDMYSFGGWAWGAPVPLNSGRYYRIDVGFRNTADGTYHWSSVDFNQDSTEWQFASGKAQADCNYDNIAVYIDFGFEANWAYFDGMQLYKENFDTKYTRDASTGNLSKVSTPLSQQSSNLTYDNANNIQTSKDPYGNITNFTYDKHNMLTSTSPEGVANSFVYDPYGNVTNTKVGNDTTFIQSSSSYTNGNYLETVTDSFGKPVKYSFNSDKGVLDNFTDAKGKVTNYLYDELNRLKSVSKTVDGQTITNSYNYKNDKIDTITHNGFSYSFGYDTVGNNTSVSVGTQNLITNTYDYASGRLLQSTYGNGNIVKSDYDKLGRVIDDVVNGAKRYTYQYDATGNLGYEEELDGSGNITKSYRYFYDITDKLTQIKDSAGNSTTYNYDLNNNLSSLAEKVNGINYSTTYNYDKDNRQTSMTYNRGTANTISNTYDSLSRKTDSTVNTGLFQFKTIFGYADGVNGSKSTRVNSISNNTKNISYQHDDNGNIIKITNPDGTTIDYRFNEANELIREDNKVLNKTIIYAYDGGGNITSKKEYAYTTPDTAPTTLPTNTISYQYDTNWKDKLTTYSINNVNKALDYDSIGNLTKYDKWSFTWDNGRELSRAQSTDGQDINFKYNSAGIRTSKNVNGQLTNYHLSGDKVTYEENSTDKIYYTYDSAGQLVSMNLNGVEYYYIKNAQGDIIGLFDKAGATVASYTYDSWGKLISIKDGSGIDITNNTASVGYKNPYRYRGYRYDTETGLYYLQSRHYNPEWGRFINADGTCGTLGELLAANMFAYCINNPVNMSDSNGDKPLFDDEETQSEYSDWVRSQRQEASEQFTNSQMNDLGYKKWRYRRDPANDSTRENDHVHLDGDGRKYQQDEFGNRRKGENSPGEPPQKAKDALKEREGWDWDANARKAAAKKAATGTVAVGSGYVVYRVVRMVPSFAPPLWWTIPENLVIP